MLHCLMCCTVCRHAWSGRLAIVFMALVGTLPLKCWSVCCAVTHCVLQARLGWAPCYCVYGTRWHPATEMLVCLLCCDTLCAAVQARLGWSPRYRLHGIGRHPATHCWSVCCAVLCFISLSAVCRHAWAGRLAIVFMALVGTLPLLAGPSALDATTISGTMVVGLTTMVMLMWSVYELGRNEQARQKVRGRC
jgi:hypothetical protein